MFSDHKSRGLNLEKTRLKDANRIQRLLVAVTIAYLWLMQIGNLVVAQGKHKEVDNKAAQRSVSLRSNRVEILERTNCRWNFAADFYG